MANVEFSTIVAECLCTTIRKLSRAMTRLYDIELQPSGTNINQLSILLTIQGLNQTYQSMGLNSYARISDIAKELKMDNSTLSRNLRVLEELGLLELIVSDTSRKTKLVKLTEKGMDQVLTAFPFWNNIQQKVREEIGADKFSELLGRLHDLNDAIDRLLE